MKRRTFFKWATGGAGALLLPVLGLPSYAGEPVETINESDAVWKKLLTPEQYEVLRSNGTERPFTSPLNHEVRAGTFACIACGLELFPSKFKYDSGTGWPSFYDGLTSHIKPRNDYQLILSRTEYHCARCGGHQGHVFNDGPQPTGLRYCNNGVALKFIQGRG